MSLNYELNTPYRDRETNEIYSIIEERGLYWKVYEGNRASIRVPPPARLASRAGDSASQPGQRQPTQPISINTLNRGNQSTYTASLPTNSARTTSQPEQDGRRLESSRAGGAVPTPRNLYSASPGTTEGLTSAMGGLGLAPTSASSGPSREPATQPGVIFARDLGGGFSEFTTADAAAGVHTRWRFGPLQTFGNHEFRPKTIMGSDDEESDESDEDSDESNDVRKVRRGKKRSKPKKTFRRYTYGDVIETALVPAPPDSVSTVSALTVRPNTRFPGGFHAGVRRFVVVDPNIQGGRVCSALPIKTYNGLGVSAPGIVKKHHAVIYTDTTRPPAPDCLPSEKPSYGSSEAPMQRQPILVLNHDKTRPLDPMARLDFFDITHLDTSLREIAVYGQVHPRYLAALESQRANVWNSFALQAGQTFPGPPQQDFSARTSQRTRSSSMSVQANSSRTGESVTTRQQQQAPVVASSSTLRPPASDQPPRTSSDTARQAQARAEYTRLRATVESNAIISSTTVRDYLRYLDQLAQSRSVARPPSLTQAQADGLAQDAASRRRWFAQVHAALNL